MPSHHHADIITQHRPFVNLFFKNTFIYIVAKCSKMRKTPQKRELSPRGAQFPFKKMEKLLFFNDKSGVSKGFTFCKFVAFKYNAVLVNVNDVALGTPLSTADQNARC